MVDPCFSLDTRWDAKPPALYWELSHVLLCGKTTGWISQTHTHVDLHTHTNRWGKFAVEASVADAQWFEGKIRDLCFVCVCVHALYTSTCAYGAFLHMPPVTSSLLWTTNTGRFEVRLTRLCVGCHLLSLLSQIRSSGGHTRGWGWEGWGTCLSSCCLSQSNQHVAGKVGRKGEAVLRH